MSENNKKSGIRTLQILLIIIGACAIVGEMAYFALMLRHRSDDNRVQQVQSVTVQVAADKEEVTQSQSAVSSTHKYNQYVFVGDSRYVGMSAYAQPEDTFIAKNGIGYEYLVEQQEQIEKACKKDKNTALIIGLGVNDFRYSLDKYVSKIKELEQKLDCDIFYMLVNPVDEEKEAAHGYSVENDKINTFNETISSELSPEVHIIDTNAYLTKKGYVTVDGVHYDNATYEVVYNYIKNTVNEEIK